MTIHGDLYYEGKEFETRMKDKKPGELSDDLRTALGMPVGPTAHRIPPPWLIAMQRYGPPPSYPHLKIPGLNAPIPDGCSFGYHAGGWGKPPVDEMGRPLYGDVFGVTNQDDPVVANNNYFLNRNSFHNRFFIFHKRDDSVLLRIFTKVILFNNHRVRRRRKPLIKIFGVNLSLRRNPKAKKRRMKRKKKRKMRNLQPLRTVDCKRLLRDLPPPLGFLVFQLGWRPLK